MSIFEDVTLGWKGEEKVIPANQVMRLIAKIESEVTLQELTQEKGPPMVKTATAYAVALNHAGFKVDVEEVYESLFVQPENAVLAVTGLVTLMMPPSTYSPKGK